MIRTIISLEPSDKDWLDRQARERRVTMTEIVRVAVRRLRTEQERASVSLDELLRRSSGIWKRREDGLRYPLRVRREWGRSK